MSPTIVNPPELHDPTPFGYGHVVTTRSRTLAFVAGQYASDDDGHVAVSDFEGQVRLALEHLRTALGAVGAQPADVVQLRTYVVQHDEQKLATIGTVLHEVWGTSLPAQTLLGVQTLALPGMLFEIDAVAALPQGGG